MRVTDARDHGRGRDGARRPGATRTSSSSSTRPAARRSASPGRTARLIRARKMLAAVARRTARSTSARSARSSRSTRRSSSALEDGGFIPVMAPIGIGADGETYNINADLVAGKLAEVLRGREAGGADQHARRARQGRQAAHRPDADARSTSCSPKGTISGGMLPKIGSALDAARNGVKSRAHHRRPRAARAAARSADRPGRRHADPQQVVRIARLAPSRRVWIFDLDNTLHDATGAHLPGDARPDQRVPAARLRRRRGGRQRACARSSGCATAPR